MSSLWVSVSSGDSGVVPRVHIVYVLLLLLFKALEALTVTAQLLIKSNISPFHTYVMEMSDFLRKGGVAATAGVPSAITLLCSEINVGIFATCV